MELWAPFATRLPFPSAGAWASGYPFRGIIHTTEGGSATGAFGAYGANNSAPHFTVAAGSVWQHIPLDQAGRALKNLSGGVETNRARAIQIEVIGFAAQPMWSDALIATMRKLMIWLEANCGIKATAPTFKPYPSSYGLGNGVRMSNATWTAFNGWCGHQHVPENDHGDPGAIPMPRLLSRGTNPVTVTAMYDPPLGPIAAVWQDDTGRVFAAVSPAGDVYAWAAAPGNTKVWYGNVRGKAYWGDRKAARIGKRDDGLEGYQVWATTSETYKLPDGIDHL